MTDRNPDQRLDDFGGRLLDLTRAQAAALDAGDLDGFALLTRQRTELYRRVLTSFAEGTPTDSSSQDFRPIRTAVAALDRQMSATLLDMLSETDA